MALQNITSTVTDFLSRLSLAEGRLVLEPLIIFIIGMVIYSIFVFKFYKFISRKDIFRLSKGGQASILKKIGYALEYIFLFPIIAFFWFFVISVLLSILSGVVNSIGNIFMISMAIMATIRLAAYYNEELSRDIAKLIPFAMLAIFLLDISGLTLGAALIVLQQLPNSLNTLIYYFLFIVVLEFILRVVTHGKRKAQSL